MMFIGKPGRGADRPSRGAEHENIEESMNPVVLEHASAGLGEIIAMEPTIRYWREQGYPVYIKACNPKLSPLVELFGASLIVAGHPSPAKALTFYLEGRVCLFETSVTMGNRAKGHLLSCGPPRSKLLNGYCQPRFKSGYSLPIVPEAIQEKVRGRVFVQLYGAEPYKAPTNEWYVSFLAQLQLHGIKGFSIIAPNHFLRFREPSDFIILQDDDIVRALAIFQLAKAAVVLDSFWLQAAGLLGKHALALCGPYTSPGRIEDFKNVALVPNACPNSPCWRNSTRMCILTNESCKCLDVPMGVVIPLLLEVLKGAQ
jgi:hypothetical protein